MSVFVFVITDKKEYILLCDIPKKTAAGGNVSVFS